jgi:predicted metal-binding membrane protein
MVAAWLYLVGQYDLATSDTDMASMWMPPSGTWLWSIKDFGLLLLMWLVMMAAMMVPSALAVLPVFIRAAARQASADNGGIRAGAFVLGYLGLWLSSSLGFALVQWVLHALVWLDPMMAPTSPWLSAVILGSAGMYQFSDWKEACLAKCRNPLGFLMNHWRPGAIGSLRLGARYGLECLGCCVAQMLVMLAVGVMHIGWMAAITGVILAEKLLPLRAVLLRQGIGVALITGALIEVLATR